MLCLDKVSTQWLTKVRRAGQTTHLPPANQPPTNLLTQDETTRYRSMLRSQNLFNKNHSVPHNIITGEVRQLPGHLPPAPLPPQQ